MTTFERWATRYLEARGHTVWAPGAPFVVYRYRDGVVETFKLVPVEAELVLPGYKQVPIHAQLVPPGARVRMPPKLPRVGVTYAPADPSFAERRVISATALWITYECTNVSHMIRPVSWDDWVRERGAKPVSVEAA